MNLQRMAGFLDFCTCVENPHPNRFFPAPLLRSAGGIQACGNPVYADTHDPDCRAILGTFEAVRDPVRETPRMDMVRVP